MQAGDRVTLDGRAVEWERHVLLPSSSSSSSSSATRQEQEQEGGFGDSKVYIKYWKPRCVFLGVFI